ncbi:MAG TPA: proline--tRNA ligase [Firmicutes bacterium]|nr:proline--tRNA ligase [Bacillota bacterium]
MRYADYYIPTLREVPSEAELDSHKLMLRAGMIRKAAAGFYSFLPLGHRVLKKITGIVEEEMDRAGGMQVLLPIVQPAEIWRQSGRWDVYGEEMLRLQDRHQRDFCLGPTHEEMITTLVKDEVRSYRELPLRIYQIQNKYRDEIRPRFGVMRAREFIMKDLYSFDRDAEGLNKSYEAMYEAYERIFTRCGLRFRAVEADSGAIGGDVSHEFMVLAPSGEAVILYCEACSFAANNEKATAALPKAIDEALLNLEEVETPGQATVPEVTAFLQVGPDQLIKTLFYATDEEFIAVLVRGDDELNEIKLGNLINKPFRLAPPEELAARLALPVGYVGPIGLKEKKVKVLADLRIKTMKNAVCGANRQDYHLRNVNPERDFTVDTFADLRLAKAGDPCSHCGHPLAETRGVEVGHIFKLGTKYSSALQATFRDEDGVEKPFIMGCYGIGVSRIVAAAIEQNNDQDGIKWPLPIAPFQVTILALGAEQKAAAEEIYQELSAAGVEVLFDDRDERPGVKFKDADLIGIPLRLTVGPKSLAQGEVEVKVRATGEDFRWPLPEITARVLEYLRNAMDACR